MELVEHSESILNKLSAKVHNNVNRNEARLNFSIKLSGNTNLEYWCTLYEVHCNCWRRNGRLSFRRTKWQNPPTGRQ